MSDRARRRQLPEIVHQLQIVEVEARKELEPEDVQALKWARETIMNVYNKLYITRGSSHQVNAKLALEELARRMK